MIAVVLQHQWCARATSLCVLHGEVTKFHLHAGCLGSPACLHWHHDTWSQSRQWYAATSFLTTVLMALCGCSKPATDVYHINSRNKTLLMHETAIASM